VKKKAEDGVRIVQGIKVHTTFKQLTLLWDVVIGCEQRCTKHVITSCAQSDKCFLILKQVKHTLTFVL
jgi:hypothetical protein